MNDIARARSISLKVMAAGTNMRCRNRELPKPAVPVTVPLALAMDPPISCNDIFCVRLMLEASKLAVPEVRNEMTEAAVVMESPVPAARVIVPVEEAKPLAERAFNPLTETVMEPAPVAVCKLMLSPAARARESAVPTIDVPDAEIVFVPAAPALGLGPMTVIPPADEDRVIFDPAAKRIVPVAVVVVPAVAPPAVMELIPKPLTTLGVAVETEIVMVERLEANPMPAPATRDTLEELAFSEKFVAAGTVGPAIETVIAPAAVAVFRVTFAPATKAREIAVPVTDVPEALMVCVPSACTLAEIEMVERFEARPIPAPATSETLEVEPLSAKFVAAVETEIVIVERLEASPIPAPATSDTLEEEAFREKFVAAAGAGTEIVTVPPAPTPTLAIPAPEKLSRLLKVPALLLVVFPSAVREMVLKFVTAGVVAEIVMLPAPTPTLIIPAPETFSRLEKVPAELDVVTPRAESEIEEVCTLAEIEIVERFEARPIPAPATSETELVDALRAKFVAAAVAGPIMVIAALLA